MKRTVISAGVLLVLAATTFWLSWFLMPDPGTTDTNHILEIVKQSRVSVLSSVTIQIVSSILYAAGLFLIARISFSKKKTMTGIILLGIGAMGLCADAFFHLLAYYMTDKSVHIQEDVIQVMTFMQTEALIFLVPLLLPLFIGSFVLVIGLRQQAILSPTPLFLFIAAIALGITGAVIAAKVFEYHGPAFSLTAIGIFAAGHIKTGIELIKKAPALA